MIMHGGAAPFVIAPRLGGSPHSLRTFLAAPDMLEVQVVAAAEGNMGAVEFAVYVVLFSFFDENWPRQLAR